MRATGVLSLEHLSLSKSSDFRAAPISIKVYSPGPENCLNLLNNSFQFSTSFSFQMIYNFILQYLQVFRSSNLQRLKTFLNIINPTNKLRVLAHGISVTQIQYRPMSRRQPKFYDGRPARYPLLILIRRYKTNSDQTQFIGSLVISLFHTQQPFEFVKTAKVGRTTIPKAIVIEIICSIEF